MPRRRRLLALPAAILLAATMITAYATTYEVTASVLNVRSGPGTAYAVKGKLVQGDTVEVMTLEGPWALISLGGARDGYVSAGYIVKAIEADVAQPAQPLGLASQPADDAVAVMASGVLPDDLPPG